MEEVDLASIPETAESLYCGGFSGERSQMSIDGEQVNVDIKVHCGWYLSEEGECEGDGC